MSRLVLQTSTPGVASAGTLEYDGRVPLFTPQGTQRGVIPGMQYFRLSTNIAGVNATGAQSLFGVGVTLSSSTVYEFRSNIFMLKTAGTTLHSMSLSFGGAATLSDIAYLAIEGDTTGTWGTRAPTSAGGNITGVNVATATAVTANMSSANQIVWLSVSGTVSINVGGTFIPQYSLSAAPGGAYSTGAGSYFAIYPVGTTGSNISVGAWA